MLIDRALTALLEELEGELELATLADHPYDADPEVAEEAPAGPDLPCEGDVPDEVTSLDNVQLVPTNRLLRRAGEVAPHRWHEFGRAMTAVMAC